VHGGLARHLHEEILAKVPGNDHRERCVTPGCSPQIYYTWLREAGLPNGIYAQKLSELTGYSVERRGRYSVAKLIAKHGPDFFSMPSSKKKAHAKCS
jgi:hypothetical protein